MGDNAIHSITNFSSMLQCSGIMLFTISPHIERAIIPMTKIVASFFDGTTLTAMMTAKSITKIQKNALGYLGPRKINASIHTQKASMDIIKTKGLFLLITVLPPFQINIAPPLAIQYHYSIFWKIFQIILLC